MTFESFRSKYLNSTRKKVLFMSVFLVISIIGIIFSITFGHRQIPFMECYQILLDHISGVVPETLYDQRLDQIIWDIRLPRAIAAILAGATLAICGAVMQSSLKNPLADPYTTGISSGASLGVALVIVLGVNFFPGFDSSMMIVLTAFVFSLIPAAIIIAVSQMSRASPTTMILTGVAVMFVFESTTTFLKLLATPEKLNAIFYWNLGSLGGVGWENMPYLLGACAISTVVLSSLWRRINILSCGEDEAKSMGVNTKKQRIYLLIIVSMCTAIIVGFTGTIGFVGLVAPHIARIFVGSNNKYLLPASALFGGAFLMLCDVLARVVADSELPVGVITSIIGGVIFIVILVKQRRSAWN